MKEFKTGAYRKLMLSFGFFFGLMLFGQVSYAQSSSPIDARITKLETLQAEYANAPTKVAFIGEVITELNLAKQADQNNEDYYLDQAVFDKVNPAVLADYTETQLQVMQTRKTALESENGGTNSREYYKLSLILGANGMN